MPMIGRADDTAKADPFRPVQPAWPDGWSGSDAKPAEAAPSAPPASEEDNEEFTFDEEAQAAPAEEPAAEPATPEPASEPVVTEVPVAATSTAPVVPSNVDLRAPHLWMATGGIVIGVSALTALALGVAMDRPDLAGATFGLGGLLGVGGLTVGVVMQNQRLEAAGQTVQPALPSGVMLKLSLSR